MCICLKSVPTPVCPESLIRIDRPKDSPHVCGPCSDFSASSWQSWPRHSSRRIDLRQRMRFSGIILQRKVPVCVPKALSALMRRQNRVPIANLIRLANSSELVEASPDDWCAVIGLFRSRASLEAENLALRHQINILRRRSPKKPTLSNIDRLVFAGLYRLDPGMLGALTIIKPETLIRWHRAGFRLYWRWKSRPQGGRPKTELEVRQFIREMSAANPLWGAPRIHGELLK